MNWYWKSSNELFTQFVARIAIEIPNAVLAMFSKLKYVNAPNFEDFRNTRNAKYLNWFIVHSKSFEGLKWEFPIWFLIWQTQNNNPEKSQITEISTEVLDKNAKPIWEKKFFNLPANTYLNVRFKRPRSNKQEVVPLKHFVIPSTTKNALCFWSDNAIWYMLCNSNDLQQANLTALVSSSYWSWHWFYITKENLRQASVVFTVRRIVKPTWINDRDQFLQPSKELSDEFKSDCLIWMLFNGSNLTASVNDLERNEKKRSIVNHFIPYSEQEVEADERFESDFLVDYMSEMPVLTPNPLEGGFWKSPSEGDLEGKFSHEAKTVLEEWKKLRSAYFLHTDPHTVRDELKLNRPDVGWYQIRNALKKRNESGDFELVSFVEFENAYKILTEKLRPKVRELGFLR